MFWTLSWFEFKLIIERQQKRLKEKVADGERSWEQTRVLWAVLMNAHFKKQGGGKYLPTDLKRLSYDEEIPEAQKPTLETFEKLVTKYGKRRKKNGK